MMMLLHRFQMLVEWTLTIWNIAICLIASMRAGKAISVATIQALTVAVVRLVMFVKDLFVPTAAASAWVEI